MKKTIRILAVALFATGLCAFGADRCFTEEELAYMPATTQIELYKAGILSPVEVLEAQIARVQRYNGEYNTELRDLNDEIGTFNAGKVNAITFDCFAEARAQAREAEERYRNGTARHLEGITVGVKDENELAGWHVDMASIVLKGLPACTDDCPLIERLRAEGAIFVFQTTVPEFYINCMTWSRLYGVTRNPWNLYYGVGGSSGGSGAALAAGFCTLATGSDMGGPIRLPSSMCSVFGSYDPLRRVPTSEIAYETLGPMTRTFDDLVLMQNVIVGPHPKNHASLRPRLDYPVEYAPLQGTKVAVAYADDWLEGGCDPDVRAALDKVVAVLQGLGAEIKVVALGWQSDHGDLQIFNEGLLSTEMYELVEIADGQQDLVSSYVVPMCNPIDGLGPKALLKAGVLGDRIHRGVQQAVFEDGCIALVMPTLATAKVPADFLAPGADPADVDGRAVAGSEFILTPVWNLLNRYPVVDVPVALGAQNVPIGIQVVGDTYDDLAAFRVAAALSMALPQNYREGRFPDFRDQK